MLYSIDQLNTSKFDPQSVMLYFLTIVNDKPQGIHNNHRISPEDVIYISNVYQDVSYHRKNFYEHVYGKSLSQAEVGGEIPLHYLYFYVS